MIRTLLLMVIIILISTGVTLAETSKMSAVSAAERCKAKSMVGTWKRLEPSLSMPTYWTFTHKSKSGCCNAHGTISCIGDCNGNVGTPMSYEWVGLSMSSVVIIHFELRTHSKKCRINRNVLELEGFRFLKQ